MGRKVAVIASANLSHKLTQQSPNGYDASGEQFDKELCRLVESYDVENILDFDLNLAERAAQEGLGQIAVLLGTLNGLEIKADFLSYEAPLGVGHMVASFGIL